MQFTIFTEVNNSLLNVEYRYKVYLKNIDYVFFLFRRIVNTALVEMPNLNSLNTTSVLHMM